MTRTKYERYNLQQFVHLYYAEQLSLSLCAREMNIDERNLWNFAKRHALTLRTHSEAQRLAYENGRKTPPNPEISIDWERFEELYYVKGMTYEEAAPIFGLNYTTLQEKAVERGYLSRRLFVDQKQYVQNEIYLLTSLFNSAER